MEDRTIKRPNEPSYGFVHLEDLPPGHIIDDRYEIKEKLGQGGFGAVYRAFDRNMDIDKALKVIPEAVASDEEAMADLQAEARTMVTLEHAHITRVYDFHYLGKIKYIDMAYIEGETLTRLKLRHRDKRVPEKVVCMLAIQIAEGLAYAHSQGVIHKDISPQNIMVTSNGQVKIMDFGIAEKMRTSMSRIEQTSSSGKLVYMSPEQLRGKDVGKEADIYSFGVVLYELLSGHPPFYKGDIQYQIFNEKPDDIEGISPALNDVTQKCLEKDYQERYRTFEEITQYLGDSTSISVAVEPTVPQSDESPLIRTFDGYSDDLNSVVFSPDGQYALSGAGSLVGFGVSTLKLWEVTSGRIIQTFGGRSNLVLSVAFSPDGRYALSGSYKVLKLWEIANAIEIRTLKEHSHWVSSVTFSSDGRYALSGSYKTLKLWEVTSGRKVQTFKGHTDAVTSVAFSPDGHYALSGSRDNTLKLWEVTSGRKVQTFKGHTDAVTSVAFSPDGSFALSGSEDKTLKLWEAGTGSVIRTLKGHSGVVASLAFSPDGRYALSGSKDKTLKLWEVDTGTEIRTFEGHSEYVHYVAFSPDCSYVLSGSWDKTMKLWNVSPWTKPSQ